MVDPDDMGHPVPPKVKTPRKRGPGRNKTRVSFIGVARAHAEEEGIPLEEMVWIIIKSLLKMAAEGDIGASKLLLDRFCGPLDTSPLVQVDVDSKSLNVGTGPPVPSTAELGRMFVSLEELGEKLIEAEFAAKKEIEELLE